MLGHTNHRLVSRNLRQRACVNAIDLQKIKSRLNSGALISVKVSLTLSNVESIGGRNLIKISTRVEENIPRLCNCRFQRMLTSQSMQTAPAIDLVTVNRVNLLARKEVRFFVQ